MVLIVKRHQFDRLPSPSQGIIEPNRLIIRHHSIVATVNQQHRRIRPIGQQSR